MVTITGATEKDGKYYCDGCGADLSAEGSVKTVGHYDGREIYGYMYNCNNCKAVIRKVFTREGENKKLWQ